MSTTTTTTTTTTTCNAPLGELQQVNPVKAPREDPWWLNGVFVIVTHIVALLALLFYTPAYQTKWLTYISWQLSTFGYVIQILDKPKLNEALQQTSVHRLLLSFINRIHMFLKIFKITLGYHRLWSHRAYTARLPLRIVLAFMGTLGFQGSIKWWVLRHRLHHRFTDTEEDPYSSAKGFWFSHMGWIFTKPKYSRMKLIDASDLQADPVVVLQHKYYVPLALSSGLLLPVLIASHWGDTLGGFLYAGLLARVLVWHVTFCINSFAHWAGDQFYSTEVSARGNFWLALFTNGEGYHNFHHEFPKDYRNGYGFFDYDPTKWIIFLLHKFTNQIPSVSRAPNNEVCKARANIELIKAEKMRAKCDWGVDPATLPTISLDDFKKKALNDGKEWLSIDGFVLDVSKFRENHPGGSKLLTTYYGKDATKAFHGGLNNHTKAAKTMLAMFRIAKIENSREAGIKD